MLRKLFRPAVTVNWDIVEKETVDEIIFRTAKIRNRIMLELMARGGMRVGEVLKLTAMHVDDQKLTIKNPKSGKNAEVVFIPKKLADRLKDSSVTVNSIRVTAVQIDISRHPELSAFTKWVYSIKSKMSLTPAQMAETYTWLATSPEVKGVRGKYFDEKNREVKSVKYTYDKKIQQDIIYFFWTH